MHVLGSHSDITINSSFHIESFLLNGISNITFSFEKNFNGKLHDSVVLLHSAKECVVL